MGKTKAAALLEQAIEKAGSKSELARRLGVAPSLITSWIRGGEPRYTRMMYLKNELKIPLDAWVTEA